MKTIAVCHQKGGVAKSTLSQSLAVDLPGVTALYDADSQGSTAKWMGRREADTPIPVSGPVTRLKDLVKAAEQQSCDWFVLDTPPDHDDETNIRASMEVADFVILPTKMSLFDLEILPKTVQIANSLGKPWMIVLTQGQRSNLLETTKSNLSDMAERMGGVFCPTVMMHRVAHSEATYYNATVTEIEGGGLAAWEMRQIANAVKEQTEAQS